MKTPRTARRLARGAATLLVCLLSPARVAAQQTGWSGSTSLGAQRQTGAVGYLGIQAQQQIAYRQAAFETDLMLRAQYQKSTQDQTVFGPGGQQTIKHESRHGEQYFADLRIRRSIGGAAFATTHTNWERDISQALEHRLLLAGGLGMSLTKSPRREIRAELITGRMREYDQSDTQLDFGVGGVATWLQFRLGSNGNFNAQTDVMRNFSDDRDLLIRSRSSLSAQFNRHFGLLVSYLLTHDRNPSRTFFDPTDTGEVSTVPRKTVTTLAVSLNASW